MVSDPIRLRSHKEFHPSKLQLLQPTWRLVHDVIGGLKSLQFQHVVCWKYKGNGDKNWEPNS